MDGVVSRVPQSIVPPAGIDNTELPQLFTTVTSGVAGMALGAAMAEPTPLVHPLTVLVTVYVPGKVTVIEAVVFPLLHNMATPAGIDNTELPQLSATVTTGVTGIAFGTDVPVPAALIQPLTVWVTV